MGLSSNVIWHQTSNSNLCKIIKSGKINCAYSLETIKYGANESFSRAFPMISFCGIPLADFEEYANKYGGASMGVRRKWSLQNNFSMVWYREKYDTLLNSQIRAFLEEEKNNANVMQFNEHQIELWNILARTKNFEGSLTVKKAKLSKKRKADVIRYANYRFYDERELRFVPLYNELVKFGIKPIITEKEYDAYKKKHNDSSVIDTIDIKLFPQDINFIIYNGGFTNIQKAIKSIDEDNNVVYLSQKQLKEDVIGFEHYKLVKENNNVKIYQ